MSATIFYFSATGNSLEVARRIGRELKDCTIRSMAAEQPEEAIGGPDEVIGFVFPVFFIGMPRLVKSFVEKLKINSGTYCFAVITYGGSAANTCGMLADILLKKGIDLAFADGVKMPGNYIVMYPAKDPDTTGGQLKDAANKVDAIAKEIARGERHPVKRKAVLLSKLGNGLLYKGITTWDEKFTADSKCNSCGRCTQVCPVKNIKMENGKPVWQHHCERCLACIQWCPQEAIQYGKKTIGRRRYHHPSIQAADIAASSSGQSPKGK